MTVKSAEATFSCGYTKNPHKIKTKFFQVYYDRFNYVDTSGFKIKRDTIDLDFRQHWADDGQHEIIWGLGFRHWDDRTRAGQATAVTPQSENISTYSGFIQDTITLSPETLVLMVGSKFEHNGFTGFEFQPSSRLSWTPNDRQTLWAAVSRPVRIPSRFSDGIVRTVDFFPAFRALRRPRSQSNGFKRV